MNGQIKKTTKPLARKQISRDEGGFLRKKVANKVKNKIHQGS